MPASSVAARSLALVFLGLCSASAMAQNVSAFNPYNGIGLPGSPAPGATPQAVGPMATPPSPGMAFNPWRPAGGPAGWGQTTPPPPAAYAAYPGSYGEYGRGSYLPAPPPGPIESRIVAIPQRGVPAPTPGRPSAAPPTPPVTVTATPPAPAVATAPPTPVQPATPEPVPLKRQPATTSGAAPPIVAQPPAATSQPEPPAPKPPAIAAVAPPPQPAPPPAQAAPAGPRPPPPAGPAMASVQFNRESAEITGEARSELDRIAKSLNSQKQVEVRAYATGPDPADARKMALARALAVRSYLIDQGVKIRIEVGAFASENRGPGSERVDILSPSGG